MQYPLCCYGNQVGAIDVIKYFLTLEDVFCSLSRNHQRYNITGILPETMPPPQRALAEKEDELGNSKGNSDLSDSEEDGPPAMSLLEIIVSHEDDVIASRILNLNPLNKLVENYWKLNYLLLICMVIHVAQMACFSVYSLESVANFNVTLGGNGQPIRIEYAGFLVIPALMFVFHFFYILSFITRYCKAHIACCSGTSRLSSAFHRIGKRLHVGSKRFSYQSFASFDKRVLNFVSPLISSLNAVIYSLFTVLWFASYYTSGPNQPFYLAVALMFGWFYTISFSKCFGATHSFSVMITYIIVMDVLRFSILYIVVVFAFGLAAHSVLQVKHLFSLDTCL